MPIGLYLDTAVGVDAGGADAWMDQDVVLRGLSVGAPPDQFNPAGQDWGLTAYNPHGLVASDFEPFRQMLRAAMRHAGAVRIDHVLGLMRLYVIPHGLARGAGRLPAPAVRGHAGGGRRGEPALALHRDRRGPRHRAGGLPRHALGLGRVVLSRRDVRAEWRRLVSPAARTIPRRAIATFNTHDLPTFAGWMSGHDLRTKRAIGVDPGETDDDAARLARGVAAALAAATGSQRIGFEDVVAFLARDADAAGFDRDRGRAWDARTRSTCRAR